MIPWLIDLGLALLSAIFSILALLNVAPIRRTKVGRYMFLASSALLVYSIAALVSYLIWMSSGHGIDVAGPSAAISLAVALASAILYRIASI
ncbi:MAG: hypothetical protein QXP98_06075 [Thermoproteus sp.]